MNGDVGSVVALKDETAGSTTNHANGANGEGEGSQPRMASIPEKSRAWLPFPIRDIRSIRSEGFSVLFPAYPCSSVSIRG